MEDKLEIYERFIKNSFHDFIDMSDRSKEIIYPDYGIPFDKRCCIEINIPRQTRKTSSLIELAIQYQKIIFITVNNFMIDHMKHKYNFVSSKDKDIHIMSVGSDKLKDFYRGINISEHIIILDEVSLDYFFDKIKDTLLYAKIFDGQLPVFSVLTRTSI